MSTALWEMKRFERGRLLACHHRLMVAELMQERRPAARAAERIIDTALMMSQNVGE